MKIDIEGISTSKIDNGIKIESDEDMYILGNIHGYDFQNKKSFNNHYSNNPELKRVVIQRHGISVISSIEKFKDKFFTNISVLIDEKLDNITMLFIYNTIHQTISTTLWKNNAIAKDKLDNELGNFYNVVYIACRGKSEKYLPYDISLFYEVKEILDEALNESLQNLNYPIKIIQTLKDHHITLDMIDKLALKFDKNIDIQQFNNILLELLKNPDIIAYLNMSLHLKDDIKNNTISELQTQKPDYKKIITKPIANITKDTTNTLNLIYQKLPHITIDDNIIIGLITATITNMTNKT